MTSAAVMRQVTAIAATERAQLTLVRLLSGVGSHMSLQVALIGRSKGTKMAAVRFLSCMNSDVLNESCCAPGGIVTVTALELPIIGPLKAIN